MASLPISCHLSRRNQALFIEADQVFPSSLQQGFLHQVIVLRLLVLKKRSLHRLLMRIMGTSYGRHGSRVKAGIVHHRRYSRGCRIEILHLLWHIAHIPNRFRKCNCILEIRSRMRRDQIRNQVLILTILLIDPFKSLAELIIDSCPRLTHEIKHMVRNVFRCNS